MIASASIRSLQAAVTTEPRIAARQATTTCRSKSHLTRLSPLITTVPPLGPFQEHTTSTPRRLLPTSPRPRPASAPAVASSPLALNLLPVPAARRHLRPSTPLMTTSAKPARTRSRTSSAVVTGSCSRSARWLGNERRCPPPPLPALMPPIAWRRTAKVRRRSPRHRLGTRVRGARGGKSHPCLLHLRRIWLPRRRQFRTVPSSLL